MNVRRALSLLAALLIAGAAAAQQRVQVDSLDRADGAVLSMPGFWFPAASTAPAPAFVLLHGCGGPYGRDGEPSARFREIAARLNALGVGALVVDSLTPRGEKELCTQRNGQRRVTQLQRRRDALGALQWLAVQPGVDAARLGFMGWSNGGSTVLAATNRRHPEVLRSPVQPSLAVAWYPGCAADLVGGWAGSAPLLMLLGGADDWTPPAPCQALAAQAGVPAPEVEVYAGAYHGFDGTAPLRLRRDVPNGVNPGQGVHVGTDPVARAAAARRLEAFLQAHWRTPTDPAAR